MATKAASGTPSISATDCHARNSASCSRLGCIAYIPVNPSSSVRRWHPKREQLGGIPCVKSVADIDGVPDAAFVASNASLPSRSSSSCGRRAVAARLNLSSGFAETGDAPSPERTSRSGGRHAAHGPQSAMLREQPRPRCTWPMSMEWSPSKKAWPSSPNPAISPATSHLPRRALPLALHLCHRNSRPTLTWHKCWGPWHGMAASLLSASTSEGLTDGRGLRPRRRNRPQTQETCNRG